MTDDEILKLSWEDDMRDYNGYIRTVPFARAVLAAGASEGQANLWARADYPVTWTRHGSGTNEWWSHDGYEARKTVSGRWVLSRAGLPIFEHEYLQEVMDRAFALKQDPSAELTALRERIAELEEFARDVSKQTPEKPDYWSSCGQCERNIDRAEDLMEPK